MENIIKYFSELFMLKREKRNGFKLIGLPTHEIDTVGEHEVVTAKIAYVLGHLEGVGPEKCALAALFHDDGETRVGDQHKVGARYYKLSEAELEAFKEQASLLPEELSKKIIDLVEQKEKRSTQEGVVVQDADWLEVALQSKILLERGFKGAVDWINNVEKALETESARKILAEIKEMDDFTNCWWQGLKKMTYKKLADE